MVRNKIDLSDEAPGIEERDTPVIRISAKNRLGIEELKAHLKQIMGFEGLHESGFIARKRHLDALNLAESALSNGVVQLQENAAGELLAEDLRAAQNALNEITGEFSSDDLLGRIFGSFCIGK